MSESPDPGNCTGKGKGNDCHVQVSASRRPCLEWTQDEVRLERVGVGIGVVGDRA